MRHMKYVVMIAIILTCSCSQIMLVVDEPFDYSIERIYQASFDDTWRALIKAIEWYPIVTIEKDSGVLHTDWVGDYSPNQYFVKQQYGTPNIEYGIGVDVFESQGSGVVVTEVIENSTAHDAGIQKGDLILRVDEYDVDTYKDIRNAINSENMKKLKVYRKSSNDTLYLNVKPEPLHEMFSKVRVRYRFNIRVSAVDENQTEVKVINFEEAKNVFASDLYWRVASARIRENNILDRIDFELREMMKR